MIPVMMNAYDHAFHESIHLATIHEIYGSHHLDKALATAGRDNENSNSRKSLNAEDLVPVHVGSAQVSCVLSTFQTVKQVHRFISADLSVIYLSRRFPPPKFS